MAIEKRMIRGFEVGFNTETNSYCNLPPDYEETAEGGDLPSEKMTTEELTQYATDRGIDIGMATSVKGILDKIKAAQVV